MPRKQNGWNNSKSFAFKSPNQKITKSKKIGAAGYYPSNRSFGSIVSRSVVEKYDMESNWARWRKGQEYFFQTAYLDYKSIDSILYQGTTNEVPITFSGYKFPTANSDSRSHYTLRRRVTVENNISLGTVQEIYSDRYQNKDSYDRNEIWIRITKPALSADNLLIKRTIGERITDGTASANVLNVLTPDKKPAVYKGKSPAKGTKIAITIPLSDVTSTTFMSENNGNLQALVGQIGYVPDFYNLRPIANSDIFTDDSETFKVDLTDSGSAFVFKILNTSSSDLPPSLTNISAFTEILNTSNTNSELKGGFEFKKDKYQRYFGRNYLTSDLVKSEVSDLAFSVLPFEIKSIDFDVSANTIELTSVPVQTTLTLYSPSENENWVILADNSFTIQSVDNDAEGNYKHKPEKPGDPLWQRINITVDPWIDQTFTTASTLEYGETYACSCPDFMHAVIRSPEQYDEQGKKLNRQRRAPVPTAQGSSTYDNLAINTAASIAQSWETEQYKGSFRICKHVIAAMFADKTRVEEPNGYPSLESRQSFEAKLAKDISETNDEFINQLKRSEITTLEIVYVLAQGLNLDEVETAYVLLTSQF